MGFGRLYFSLVPPKFEIPALVVCAGVGPRVRFELRLKFIRRRGQIIQGSDYLDDYLKTRQDHELFRNLFARLDTARSSDLQFAAPASVALLSVCQGSFSPHVECFSSNQLRLCT